MSTLTSSRLESMRAGDTLQIGEATVTRLTPSRINGDFRIDWMGYVDDEWCSLTTRFVPNAGAVRTALAIPATFAQPSWLLERRHELGSCASRCYKLRDAAFQRGAVGESEDFHQVGDVYFGRVLAIANEWEPC